MGRSFLKSMRPAGLWERVPVVVKAIVAGVLVTGAGTLPWMLLTLANRRYFPAAPWGAFVQAVYLCMYWRYLRGAGRADPASQWKRSNLRARPLSESLWGLSLFAGVIGLGALIAFQKLWARLVPLAPEQRASDLSGSPLFSLVISLTMASIVAGVTEEAGFRGYMQGMIERRHGPVIAILVSGTVFGFAHFTHPQVGFANMPYYIGASAVYGTLAYFTGSILPGVVLHAAGDTLEFLLLVAQGQNTPLAPAAQPLIWASGPDLYFWARCAWAALWITAAIWSFRAVAQEVPEEILTTESRQATSGS